MPPESLPKSLKDLIEKGHKYGYTTISCSWKSRRRNERHVTAIHWRSGEEPCSLVKTILEKVDQKPMPLTLDGKLYLIQEATGKLVPDDDGGERYEPL